MLRFGLKKDNKVVAVTHNRAKVIQQWVASGEVGHPGENVYNETHYSTEMMM